MKRDDLLFDAAASVCYHRRRAAFLEHANLAMTVFMVIAGSGAIVTFLQRMPVLAVACAITLAVVGAIKLVYKPDHCARDHRKWLERWCDILAEVETTARPNGAKLADWIKRRREIERECVAEMNALKADCWNRTARAQKRAGKPYRLRWRHRSLMHVYSFDNAFEHQEIDGS